MTTKEAAIWTGIAAKTLREWRNAKPFRGPPCYQISSGNWRYSLCDLRAWRAARMRSETH